MSTANDNMDKPKQNRRREQQIDTEEDAQHEDSPPRKKQKRSGGVRHFFDLAAVSDNEALGDEDEDDEDGVGESGSKPSDIFGTRTQRIDDFIQDAEELDATGNQSRPNINLRTADVEEKSPEQIVKELAERYQAQRKALKFTGEGNSIPQHLLIPSVDDPSLWQVRVKPGRERELVFRLLRKSIDLAEKSSPLKILSVFARDSIQGSIYIEAYRAEHVSFACAGMLGIYLARSGVQLVPIEERAALLQLKSQEVELVPGSWVRFKRGTYRGDLAQVQEVIEPGEYIAVRFVPRIDLSAVDEQSLQSTTTGDSHRKKFKSFMGWVGANQYTDATRPPQKLFNSEQVRDVYGHKSVTARNQVFIFQNEQFKDGFVEKDVKKLQLIWEDVNPTLAELTYFSAGNEGTAVDLSALYDAGRKAVTSVLKAGDRVEVFEGAQAGVYGIVAEIQNEIVTISVQGTNHEAGKLEMLDAPARSVRKRFRNGDHVKVISGFSAGETGLVVYVHDNVVTFLSDMNLQEISVLAKDIQEVAEIGSGVNIVGNYELHQLVQLDPATVGVIFKTESSSLRVLDENNEVRHVQPHQIPFAVAADSRLTAKDATGHPIRIGDLMKESVAQNSVVVIEPRNGRVLHIVPRSAKLFLYNRELQQENGGVFVVHEKKLVSQTARDPEQSSTSTSKTGDSGRGPKDHLAGANVVIVKGPFKGYAGEIIDTNASKARVELQAGNRAVLVDKTMLRLRLPNGQLGELDSLPPRPPGGFGRPSLLGSERTASNSIPLGERGDAGFGSSWGAPPTGSGTSNWAGGKTPGWGGAGKTPNPYLGGGTTPAWSTSSKTPNPYASGETAGNWGPGDFGVKAVSGYDPPEDWLLDPAYKENLGRIKIRISGTVAPPYLDGEFEGKIAQVVVASRVATEFVQTAMIEFPDGTTRAAFPVKYMSPLEPTRSILNVGSKDVQALVLEHPKLKGKVVRLWEVPEDDSKNVVIEPVDGVLEIERDRLVLLRPVRVVDEAELEEGEILM